MKPYEKLAAIYDKDWGLFSVHYLDIINHVKQTFNFNPESVLDLGCGTGVLAAALADAGLKVDACDISPEMLAVARSKSSVVNFFDGDMRDIKTDKTYDLIVSAFDSINYLLNESDVAATFKSVKQHLNPDGLFLFDVNTPGYYLHNHHGSLKRKMGDQTIQQKLDYSGDGLAMTTFIFPDGSSETHTQKAYTKTDIERLLQAAGLEVKDAYDNIDNFTSTTDQSKRIYFVVQAQVDSKSA